VEAAVPKRYKVVEAQGVVVRAGFDMKSKPHGQLSNGEEVECLESKVNSKGTTRIRFKGRLEGWVSLKTGSGDTLLEEIVKSGEGHKGIQATRPAASVPESGFVTQPTIVADGTLMNCWDNDIEICVCGFCFWPYIFGMTRRRAGLVVFERRVDTIMLILIVPCLMSVIVGLLVPDQTGVIGAPDQTTVGWSQLVVLVYYWFLLGWNRGQLQNQLGLPNRGAENYILYLGSCCFLTPLCITQEARAVKARWCVTLTYRAIHLDFSSPKHMQPCWKPRNLPLNLLCVPVTGLPADAKLSSLERRLPRLSRPLESPALSELISLNFGRWEATDVSLSSKEKQRGSIE
jgi:Cys-rich protein (TIGR01571 family)